MLYAHRNLFAVFLYTHLSTPSNAICTYSNISYQFPSCSMSVGLRAVRQSIYYVFLQANLSKSSLCSHNQVHSWHATLIITVSNLQVALCLTQLYASDNAPAAVCFSLSHTAVYGIMLQVCYYRSTANTVVSSQLPSSQPIRSMHSPSMGAMYLPCTPCALRRYQEFARCECLLAGQSRVVL